MSWPELRRLKQPQRTEVATLNGLHDSSGWADTQANKDPTYTLLLAIPFARMTAWMKQIGKQEGIG